ncbi:GDP-mannose transporter [Trifolium medium]|uniref:GDP-mannose transporter n=1 Tax=Trifolium medium TaxID=97028 RepID=A0A392N662_9FABA|nr:GDP-mannose transporter [Trifolium medium]
MIRNECANLVKEAYHVLINGEEEECDWAGDVWNQLIPSNMSTLVWRLFQKRLPTKENLMKRGMMLNSSSLYVGDCGNREKEDHLFFHCPTMGERDWEMARNHGSLNGGGRFSSFNSLPGSIKTKDRIGVIWFTVVSLISKARNDDI